MTGKTIQVSVPPDASIYHVKVMVNIFILYFKGTYIRCLDSLCRSIWRITFGPFTVIFSETAHWIFTKLHRKDPWVVPYQSCSNHFSWLHKYVTGSKNRFSKCSFQKSSCPKLQGPELSYLVYNII